MSRIASADTYPSRPLRWIVPFPAGGSTDLIARLLGEWLAARLGQPVIIENKPGGVRALAVLSAKRTPALPDVPTMGETIAGFEVTPWTALGVPSGTSAEIIERLNREINAGLADPGIRARMAEVGGVPLVYSPAELRALIARDAAKWAKVVEQAGIKPE
jgi:tripartite-type tricarboxylate transporter receptor subunit TctC